MNRRTFLRTASVGAVGLVLTPQLALLPAPSPPFRLDGYLETLNATTKRVLWPAALAYANSNNALLMRLRAERP